MHILKTLLSPERVCDRLAGSDCFEGNIEITRFRLREKAIISNRLLFPIIEGDICENGEGSDVSFCFKLRKADIIGFGIFFAIIFLLGVVFSSINHDILIFICFWAFGLICAMICTLYYLQNCHRALRRIKKLFKDEMI